VSFFFDAISANGHGGLVEDREGPEEGRLAGAADAPSRNIMAVAWAVVAVFQGLQTLFHLVAVGHVFGRTTIKKK